LAPLQTRGASEYIGSTDDQHERDHKGCKVSHVRDGIDSRGVNSAPHLRYVA
jgi:hypothetical protein